MGVPQVIIRFTNQRRVDHPISGQSKTQTCTVDGKTHTHTITHTYYIHFKYHIIIARFTTKNCSKDQIEQNIAISMHFTKIAQLFESSAPQLFTMLSCDSQILGTTLAVNSTFFPQTVYS